MSKAASNMSECSEIVQVEPSQIQDEDRPVAQKIFKLRSYTLNDVGALKKIIQHEKRGVDIEINKQAKNLSNVIVPMRASLFEHVKAKFIIDLHRDPTILKDENAEGVKAPTDSHGDALVEYSIEITFCQQDYSHTIRLTAYTTTSQLMIQPLGEKAGPIQHLG